MHHRSPLQHLLHNLIPSRGPGSAPSDFVDTQPVDARAAAAQASRRAASPQQLRQSTAGAESALDLAAGSEITEFPDDAAADLMDEFFAQVQKKAA